VNCTTLLMKIFGILQLAALCALFDASSALPTGHEHRECSSQGSEYNCGLGIVFIALRRDGDSGLNVYKAGQKRRRQDDT
jgi:hypothetical protein